MELVSESPSRILRKEIITEGIPPRSAKPTIYSLCRIKIYDVTYPELSADGEDVGQVFPGEDLKHCPLERTITMGDVSTRVDACIEKFVKTMRKGEQSLARITDPSCDKVLAVFKIELVDYEAHKRYWLWTPEAKYEVASKYKKSGDALLEFMWISEACSKFNTASWILRGLAYNHIDDRKIEKSLWKDIVDLRTVLYNKMAECHLIRKSYEDALQLCRLVLAIDKNNVEALCRRAVVYENIKVYHYALSEMEKVVHLEPNNSAAQEKLLFYRAKVAEARDPDIYMDTDTDTGIDTGIDTDDDLY